MGLLEAIVSVALAFESGVQFMELKGAERLYATISAKSETQRTAEDARLHAALTIALGTLPDDRRVARCPSGHQPLCETQRGRSLPPQGVAND